MNEVEQATAEIPEPICCPSCLAPNPEQADFCSECGAPLSNLSVTGPWERIQASGFAYRQAVSGPPKKIILIGIWVLFLPCLLSAAFWLGIMLMDVGHGDQESLGRLAIMPLFGALCAGILIRTTLNYLKNSKSSQAD